jgi:hypothetical protein
MLRAVETAPTHSEVRAAVPRIMHRSHELLLPLPPYQRSEEVPRMRPSASLCWCAIYSRQRSGPWVFEVDDSVGVSWPYAQL